MVMTRRTFILAAALAPAFLNLNAADKVNTDSKAAAAVTSKIIVGGGCFWCVEAVMQRLPGVSKVVSGYSGGHVKNPTYEQICEKNTGHAEVCEVTYDPATVKLDTVLDVFFSAHDPTTLNRQGADVGPQYRSCVFYANEEQKKAAEAAKERARAEWGRPAVTEIAPLKEFYAAEAYHQNYYNLNKDRNPYCSVVIGPKIAKLVKKGVIKP
jgi:peptide-methionine (S)-S-oxide reductase